jgi:COP9 signalosome complex subunit 1
MPYQLLIEQRNYAHVTNYVFKAEAALDASKVNNRDSVQTKIELATALAHLGQNNYDRAAYGFLKLGPAKNLGDWLGNVNHFYYFIFIFFPCIR